MFNRRRNIPRDHCFLSQTSLMVLVCHYPFNGDFNDWSGYNRHATPSGDPQAIVDRFGNEDMAYFFDGNGDYLSCGNWFDYQDFTLSFWVNQVSLTGYYVAIIDNNHTDSKNWVVQYNEDDWSISLRNCTTRVSIF